MIGIVKQPPALSLTGNPISFEFFTDASLITNHRMNIKIYSKLSSATSYTLIAEDSKPVIDERASFDIAEFLKRNYEYQFLFPQTLTATRIDIAQIFQIEYFETYNYDGIQHELTTYGAFIVLQGSISKYANDALLAANSSFYADFIVSKKKFLSFSPSEKTITNSALEYLYYFNMSAQSVKLKADVYYTIGTNETLTLGTFALLDFSIYEFPASPAIINKSNVSYYKVYLTTTGNTIITELKKFVIDSNYKRNLRQFFFKNNLSVFDSIEFTGEYTVKNKFDRSTGFRNNIKQVLDSGISNFISINSGFITDELKKYVNVQLFMSINTYEISEGVRSKVALVSKDVEESKSNDFLHSIEMEYEKVYNDYYGY